MFERSGRPGSRKILVFFTNKTPKRSLINNTKSLEEKNIKVIPVALGNDVDVDRLGRTNPDSVVIVVPVDNGDTTIEDEALKGIV